MIFPDKYWRIAKQLQKKKIVHSDLGSFDFSESDLFNLNIGKRGGDFFLGYYSKEGVKIALEKYGVYAELKNRGFHNVITDIDTSDPFKHKITVFQERKDRKNMLVELVLRKSIIKVNMPYQTKHNGRSFQNLTIDWLAMQNPKGEFTPRRPRLPGQRFPGLGLSIIAAELLMITCWRLKLEALVNFPGHYHNAYLYSRVFYYLDPLAQANFLALKKTFKSFPLDKLSWGIDWGCVSDVNTHEPFTWIVSEQLAPMADRLKKVFKDKKYDKYVKEKIKNFQFTFNEEKYQEIKKKITVKSMEKII